MTGYFVGYLRREDGKIAQVHLPDDEDRTFWDQMQAYYPLSYDMADESMFLPSDADYEWDEKFYPRDDESLAMWLGSRACPGMTTILDAVRNHGDSADVYDAVYDDGGMGWVVDEDMKDGGDAFDRVVYRLAETIEVEADNGPYSVVARISDYIEANLDMWVEFGREFNTDRAQISDDEEGIYWAVRTVQNLACGMYSDEAYEWLEKRMFAQEGE